MAVEVLNQSSETASDMIEVPAPTPWPIVFAFGLASVAAGLVTTEAITVLGAVVAAAGAVGWFRDVLPEEAHELLPVQAQAPAITTSRREVERAGTRELQRAWLPVEIYPVSAGVKGGL